MVLKQVQSHRSLSERGRSRQRAAEAVGWQEQIRWPQNDKEWIFPLSLQIKESCFHFDCSFVVLAFTFWPPASVKQLISIVFTTNCVIIYCTSKEKWMQTIMANSSIKFISVKKCSVYKKIYIQLDVLVCNCDHSVGKSKTSRSPELNGQPT